MLAAVAWDSPLFWAVMIGWIMSVVLHEFAHGLAAFLGGDYTIRERGGLSLNPLQYVDPVGSLLFPAIFLLLGGIPLPGGSTYIRRDLLRNRWWDVAVSLAGPAANLLTGIGLILLIHPKIGPLGLDPGQAPTPAFSVLATLAFLQIFAVLLNLLPIPPLDGFQAIDALLPEKARHAIRVSGFATVGLMLVFAILWMNQEAMLAVYQAIFGVMGWFGLDARTLDEVRSSIVSVLFGG